MRVPITAWLGLIAIGCAPVIAEAPAPRVPSTHRDPPAHVPPPEERGETGRVVALAASAGEEQARDLVVALVIAVRDQDLDAVTALLAPSIFFTATLRGGRAPASVTATSFAQQLVATARLAQIRGDAALEELVDPASIRVDPVTIAFPEGLPAELEPADRLVRFETAPLGRRALAALAHDGTIALVIRTAPSARIVAR